MTQDLTGRVFGRMTVVGPAGPEHGPLPPTPTGWWVGTCQCGRQTVAPGEAFLSRRLESCGRPDPTARLELAEQLAARQPPSRI
jgi:hypothetical protein